MGTLPPQSDGEGNEKVLKVRVTIRRTMIITYLYLNPNTN